MIRIYPMFTGGSISHNKSNTMTLRKNTYTEGKLYLPIAMAIAMLSVLMLVVPGFAQASTITGVITKPGGTPTDHWCAQLFQFNEQSAQWTSIDFECAFNSKGTYTLSVPTTGTYRVGFVEVNELGPYRPEFYRNASTLEKAIDIPIAANQVITGIDAQLEWLTESIDPQFLCSDVSQIPQSECEALAALVRINESAKVDDWFTNSMPCSWSAIGCSDGHVTELILSNTNLTTIPVEIGDIISLTYLSLSDNALTSLPSEIERLSSLRTIELDNNQLRYLPESIVGLWGNLGVVEIDSNLEPPEVLLRYVTTAFNCGIVNTISETECDGLIAFFRENFSPLFFLADWLKAEDPCEWVGITCSGGHITEFKLTDYPLIQNVPAEIGQLEFLVHLDLSDNGISYNLPNEVFNLPSLQLLDVSGNPLPSFPVRIETQQDGQGTIMRDIAGHYYQENTAIQLIAAPEQGWQFVRWESTETLSNDQTAMITIRAIQDATYTAIFEPDELNSGTPTALDTIDELFESMPTLYIPLYFD